MVWYRPTMLGLTLVILAFGLVVFVMRWRVFDAAGFLGLDYRTHLVFAERFLDTGSMYLPYQLAGPYDPQPLPHVPAVMPSMYPPHAIYLFAPFLVLPAILWWVIPVGLTAYVVATFRPAPWTWPVIAALVALPHIVAALIVGNTTMWLVAFVAAGLRWHWPAVLVTLKPSLAPFALIGLRHRSWWVAALALAIVSLPMLPSWFDYLAAVRNGGASPLYSIGSVPAMLIPVVAWLGRRRIAA